MSLLQCHLLQSTHPGFVTKRCLPSSRPPRFLRTVRAFKGSSDDYNRQRKNVRFWNEEQSFLRRKWIEKTQQRPVGLPSILPVLLGIGIAGFLGPMVLAFALGFAGLAVSAVMGFTALTFFLPFILLGTLAMSVLAGALQLAFAIPLLGTAIFAFSAAKWAIKRSMKAEMADKQQRFDQKEHEWRLDDREAERLNKQELFDFDKRLEKRTDPSAL